MEKLLAESLVRDVKDFPKPGIMFKDITPVVQDADALKQTIDKFAEWGATLKPDVVVGIEARGFIFGAPLAIALGVCFVPLRKLGKLPGERVTEEYALEYGTNTVEMHTDAIKPGQRVIVIDDLLATGGTAGAACRLSEKLGGVVVGCGFLIELDALEGRKVLSKYEIHSLIRYQ